MLAFQPMQVVILATDVTRIEWVGHDLFDALEGDPAARIAWKAWIIPKMLADFRVAGKTTRSVAFKRFFNCCGVRLICDQEFPTPLNCHIPVAHGRFVDPIAVLHARFHLLGNLPSVLLALQRALGCHNGFNEFALWGVLKSEVETFDSGIARAECFAQIEMESRVAGKAFEIIKDDNEALFGLCIEIGQQGDHTGSLHEVATTTDGIGKDGLDSVSLLCGIFAAARFLALQAIAFLFLRPR